MRVLVVDNYDSFTYNLAQHLMTLGAEVEVVLNDEPCVLEKASGFDRVVISPGPGTPARAGATLSLVRAVAGRVPLLGVCLGHQAIGEAFGGRVVRAPVIFHGKVSEIHHDGRGIYRGVPNPFPATRYHSLVLDPGSLPGCLEVSARTDEGVIMGVRHRRLAAEGVQYHPESVLTRDGLRLLANFLEAHRDALQG